MSPPVQYARFNLVGALGAGFQVATIRGSLPFQPTAHPGRDNRAGRAHAAAQLLLAREIYIERAGRCRLHSTGSLFGFISQRSRLFSGNISIAWALVARAGWTPVLANLFAIVACSAAIPTQRSLGHSAADGDG